MAFREGSHVPYHCCWTREKARISGREAKNGVRPNRAKGQEAASYPYVFANSRSTKRFSLSPRTTRVSGRRRPSNGTTDAYAKAMINRFSIGGFAIPVLGAAFAFVGCAAHDGAPPAQAPVSPVTEMQPAAQAPPPAPVVVAFPSVSVSEELAAACRLHFNDVNDAPKFDFDISKVGPQDSDILKQIAACVTTGPLAGRALDLVGRADPRGEVDYNLALGDRRATSVRQYLAGLGVDDAKLAESSRGNRDATGTDESGWQRDRRVDILLH